MVELGGYQRTKRNPFIAWFNQKVTWRSSTCNKKKKRHFIAVISNELSAENFSWTMSLLLPPHMKCRCLENTSMLPKCLFAASTFRLQRSPNRSRGNPSCCIRPSLKTEARSLRFLYFFFPGWEAFQSSPRRLVNVTHALSPRRAHPKCSSSACLR